MLRVAGATALLTAASLALVASCSGSPDRHGAPVDAASLVPPNPDPYRTACPSPSGNAARCTGDDPGFVFFPPLECDPAADAAQGTFLYFADGGLNPCAEVTTFDVVFTPASCRSFVAAEDSGNIRAGSDPSAPVIDGPLDGAMLSPDEWSLFYWHAPAQADARGTTGRALDWLEPSAYAYGPLQGDGYVLEFSQGCTEVLRIYIAETFWAPDPTSWSKLTSLSGPVELRVFAMHFVDDALTTVPVVSAPITITMTDAAGASDAATTD